MISFIQKNLYTYFAIYIVNIIEYRFSSYLSITYMENYSGVNMSNYCIHRDI